MRASLCLKAQGPLLDSPKANTLLRPAHAFQDLEEDALARDGDSSGIWREARKRGDPHESPRETCGSLPRACWTQGDEAEGRRFVLQGGMDEGRRRSRDPRGRSGLHCAKGNA